MRAKQATARKCTIERRRNKALAEMAKCELGVGREGELYITVKGHRDPTANKVSCLLKKRKLNI